MGLTHSSVIDCDDEKTTDPILLAEKSSRDTDRILEVPPESDATDSKGALTDTKAVYIATCEVHNKTVQFRVPHGGSDDTSQPSPFCADTEYQVVAELSPALDTNRSQESADERSGSVRLEETPNRDCSHDYPGSSSEDSSSPLESEDECCIPFDSIRHGKGRVRQFKNTTFELLDDDPPTDNEADIAPLPQREVTEGPERASSVSTRIQNLFTKVSPDRYFWVYDRDGKRKKPIVPETRSYGNSFCKTERYCTVPFCKDVAKKMIIEEERAGHDHSLVSRRITQDHHEDDTIAIEPSSFPNKRGRDTSELETIAEAEGEIPNGAQVMTSEGVLTATARWNGQSRRISFSSASVGNSTCTHRRIKRPRPPTPHPQIHKFL